MKTVLKYALPVSDEVRMQLRPEPSSLDEETLTTINECAEATRMHLAALHKHTSEKRRRGPVGDVIQGLHITMSKLEYLRDRKELTL